MSETNCIEYRDAVGFPGYRVSNTGEVWSCRGRKHVESGFDLLDEWHRINPEVHEHGYLRVHICCGVGKSSAKFVHCLVLEAFVGPRPEGMECCHFPDRNPANNNLSNLRWDTKEANQADSAKHGTKTRGESHGTAKLTENDIRQIRAEYTECQTAYKKLGKKYHVATTTIAQIIRMESWKHVV